MAEFDTTGYVDISGDGGILKKIVTEGEGDCPSPDFEVEAHYTGTLDDGTEFDSSRKRGKPFKFTIGKGQVIKGWDQGFATMKKGEKALLRCRSDYAYGESGQGPIPAGATLTFDVELLKFGPKKKEPWEMTAEEKEAEAEKLKEAGTQAFKEKDFVTALSNYEAACEMVNEVDSLQHVLLSCKANCALMSINLQDYASAVAFATDVLKIDPHNVKALYRRALARNHLGMAEEALSDLNAALAIDPDNKPAKNELVKSKKLLQEAKKKTKAAYGNFFSKMSVYDDKEAPVVPGTSPNNPKVEI